MAVNITGSKYGDSLITAVGTSTVTIGVPTFVVNDFKVPRRAQLHSAAGVKKGDAFVRACYNSTLIELETPFQNWKDGSTVTQAIGDIVLISKNFADVVTSGIAVSGLFITLSDSILFGTDNQPKSVCFHDEGKSIQHTIVSTFYLQVGFSGGTVTFGHLQSWANKSVYSPCNYRSNTATGNLVNFIYFTSDSASFMMFGGTVAVEAYVGQAYNGSAIGVDAAYFWALSVRFENVNILSRNLGGDWNDGTNHLLESCFFTGNTPSLIMVRWGNGLVKGGFYKITNFSSDPISVFGSDAAGTFPIGAPAGQRAVVADSGNNIPLWRSNGTVSQDINATNLLAVNFDLVQNGGAAQTNATLLQYFSDTYSALQAGSVGVVTLDADSSIVDSSASTSTVWSATVKYDKYIGKTHQTGFPLGPWTYGIKKYGYSAESGAITVSNYDLGTAGVAKNVSFGGAIIQTPDTSVTLSQAAANALTTLPTLDNVYDRTIAWSVLNVTNAQYPSLGAYMANAMGSTLDFGSRNIVIDATAGVAFAVNTGTNTVTIKATTLGVGTKFIKLVTSGTIMFSNGAAPSATLVYQSAAGTSVPVTAPNLISGTRVQIYDVLNSVELANVLIGSGGYVGRFPWSTDKTIRLRAAYCVGTTAKLPVESIATLTNTGASFLTSQATDAVYNAVGIDGSSVTEFAGDYPNVQIDVTDPDGVTTVPRIYAWFASNLATSVGIANFFGGLAAVDAANFVINTAVLNLKLDNTNVAPVLIAGGRLYRSDGSTVIAATSNSIQMDPDRVYTVETGTSGLTGPESAKLFSLETASIKAKTDNLPSDPADQSLLISAINALPTGVRTELGTELARIDAAVSSRLAIGAYTAPANGDTTAIRNLLEADEYHTASTVQKKLRGTATVLLTKTHTGVPLTSLEVVQ